MATGFVAALCAALWSLAMPVAATAEETLFRDAVTGEALDGRLDPQAFAVAAAGARGGGLPAEMGAKRAAFDKVFADLSGPPEYVFEVYDVTVPGADGQHPVPARVYRPRAGTLPAVVYTHGGGFEKGSLASHDAALRRLANRSGALVLAVGYRLAPEHRFPAQADDAFNALRWVASEDGSQTLRSDPMRVAVAGDSVGGNLAALSALRARDEGGPALRAQVLFYPVTDLSLSSRSWRQFADGPWLSLAYETNALQRQYLPEGIDPDDPRLSPLRADPRGLPSAFVANAEFDGYRDEGQAYAQRLRDAGVPVVGRVYPGQIHDFFLMAGKVDAGERLIEDAAAELRRAFGT